MSNRRSFIGIIPARYESSRFPGKPLADICGMTMIERVYRQASKELSTVIVATDDMRIARAVDGFGGKVVVTSHKCRSGTERCCEVVRKLSIPRSDVVINIQGDEPFIDPSMIRALRRCFRNPSTEISTIVRPFDPQGSYEQLADPNRPKVVVDRQGFAMYFSRSVMPYVRNYPCEEWPRRVQYYTHVGIYAYRADVLDRIARIKPSPLEEAESLEQLRWLYAGLRIKVAVSNCSSMGIDTPEDLQRAIDYCKANNL